MVEKKQRFTFVNNHDTALTAKPDPEIPKKRSRRERGSSSSSDEAFEKAKKRLKKEKRDKKEKKAKKRDSSSSESSGDDEQSRIRNAAIAQIAEKFNYRGEQKPERDASKDEPAPKVNQWTGAPYSSQFYAIYEKRKELPAWAAKNEILKLVKKY